MTANTLRRWTVIHRWTSLFCTVNLFVLSLTGLILIFHVEIDHALGTVPEVAVSGSPRLPLEQLVRNACQAHPGWSPMTYFEDEDRPGFVFISLCPPGVKDFAKAKPLLLNVHTGLIAKVDLEGTFTAWILKLHANLFLGFFGELFLALIGVAFFAALVSGGVVYAPFMRNLLFATLRRERGARVFQLDLHNLVGIATLGWCSVVALTGIILELEKPILAVYQTRDLAAMTAPWRGQPPPAHVVPLGRAAAAAEQAWPGHHIEFALFPGTPYSGEHHYTFFMSRGSGISKRVLKLALIDASTGGITAAIESPWYIKALFISGPLHFGDYAGIPLKIIWALFAILTLVLCVSGLYLFVARMRTRRGGVSPSQPSIEEAVR